LYFKLILQIMQFKLQYLSVSKKRACKTGCWSLGNKFVNILLTY
jgi:hypothetical protein